MRTLIVFILLMSVSGSGWAVEDCKKIRDGVNAESMLDISDAGIARQNCRIANALENLVEALKK